jgi:hypothetical protein
VLVRYGEQLGALDRDKVGFARWRGKGEGGEFGVAGLVRYGEQLRAFNKHEGGFALEGKMAGGIGRWVKGGRRATDAQVWGVKMRAHGV